MVLLVVIGLSRVGIEETVVFGIAVVPDSSPHSSTVDRLILGPRYVQPVVSVFLRLRLLHLRFLLGRWRTRGAVNGSGAERLCLDIGGGDVFSRIALLIATCTFAARPCLPLLHGLDTSDHEE